jgi:hypothetical protein
MINVFGEKIEEKTFLIPMQSLELKEFLGKRFQEIFQTEISNIIQPLKKYLDKGYPLSLGKEIWEYVVCESLENSIWSGAGNSIVDVSYNNVGCDVKSISILDGSHTTEASLYQTFKETTSSYFYDNNSNSLWSLFVDGWQDKVCSVKDYRLLIIVRDKNSMDCSICGFKPTGDIVLYSDDNYILSKHYMKINSLIDYDFADIKIYKSKTRLEIRLKRNFIQNSKYFLPIFNYNESF